MAFGSLKNLPYIQWDVDNASQVAHAEDYIPGYRLIKYSQYVLRPISWEKWVAVGDGLCGQNVHFGHSVDIFGGFGLIK